MFGTSITRVCCSYTYISVPHERVMITHVRRIRNETCLRWCPWLNHMMHVWLMYDSFEIRRVWDDARDSIIWCIYHSCMTNSKLDVSGMMPVTHMMRVWLMYDGFETRRCITVSMTCTGWRRLIGSPKQRSFSTKEPLNIGHFCGKWPIKIRDLMTLCYPVWLYQWHVSLSCHQWYVSLWHRHVWVMSHRWLSHVSHYESCHTDDWVMYHIMSHVTQMTESCITLSLWQW